MCSNPAERRLHALVKGRVQGVFFRDFVQRLASGLSLAGWVRNLPDGTTVEVVAEGPDGELQRFVEQLGEGPPHAMVERVDVEWGEVTGEFATFSVR